MTQMTRAIYSETLCHRFQYYDDGVIVGFCNPVQDKEMAEEFVRMHVEDNLSPYTYILSDADKHNETLVLADDWVTIYER